MSKLPRVSGQECVKALQRAGFEIKRQKGDHVFMQRRDPPAITTLPQHRELDRGTLRAILNQAKLTVEEFTELL